MLGSQVSLDTSGVACPRGNLGMRMVPGITSEQRVPMCIRVAAAVFHSFLLHAVARWEQVVCHTGGYFPTYISWANDIQNAYPK